MFQLHSYAMCGFMPPRGRPIPPLPKPFCIKSVSIVHITLENVRHIYFLQPCTSLILVYLAEHGDHGVEHDVGLRQVGGGTLDENVRRFQSDTAKVAVDNRGQGQHVPV